ncbi:MAG: hypothetical protein HFJ47_02835 [Clostridia bacterium]|nr:hypothetical protein [Clostridia bacterium]
MDKKDQQSLNKILRQSGIVPTDSQLKFLAYNIRKYTSEILSNSDKFMLSRFSGYPGTNYVNNKLLQYLSILPVQIRPTLLTADKNLTAKAKSMDLNYIGKISFCSTTQVLVKDFGLGVRIYKIGNTLYANYAGTSKMEIIHNGNTIIYHRNDMTPVVPGDLIYFYDKCKGAITKRHLEYNYINQELTNIHLQNNGAIVSMKLSHHCLCCLNYPCTSLVNYNNTKVINLPLVFLVLFYYSLCILSIS